MTGVIIALIAMVILMAGGVWIAFAMGIAALIGFFPSLGLKVFHQVGLQTWGTSASFILTAIPLFILMADILSCSGISDRIYTGVSKLIHGMPGGLLQSNIASCAVFSAISGSSTATAATVTRIAYPELVRRGYEPTEVAASLAAGGTLGILIPPSIAMIIYGDLAGQSIGQLFLGGVVPGLLLSGMFMAYIALRSVFKKPGTLKSTDAPVTLIDRVKGFIEMWPLLLVSVLVLGCIYGGVTTPTEAAGVGVIIALVLTIALRRFTWRVLYEASISSVRTTAMVLLVVISANMLGKVLAYYRVPAMIAAWAQGIEAPMTLFVMICVLYIVLGCFFDGLSMMLLTLPFVLPALEAAGFDLVWFGVVLVILIETGLLTPPVGINLFVLQGMTSLPLLSIARASIPYIVILVVCIVPLTVWPSLVLWLPSTMIAR